MEGKLPIDVVIRENGRMYVKYKPIFMLGLDRNEETKVEYNKEEADKYREENNLIDCPTVFYDGEIFGDEKTKDIVFQEGGREIWRLRNNGDVLLREKLIATDKYAVMFLKSMYFTMWSFRELSKDIKEWKEKEELEDKK